MQGGWWLLTTGLPSSRSGAASGPTQALNPSGPQDLRGHGVQLAIVLTDTLALWTSRPQEPGDRVERGASV